MKLKALVQVNQRLYPAIADNKQGVVTQGEIIEVSSSAVPSAGYLWRNILNTPRWVAQGYYDIQTDTITTPFFEIIETDPLPDPDPIPPPDPVPNPDCSLVVRSTPLTGTNWWLWDSVDVIGFNEFDVQLIFIKDDSASTLSVLANGADSIKLVDNGA